MCPAAGRFPSPTDRPNVLVIAEACNPTWVSVPLVGYMHVAALREVAEVHLVTHERNERALIDAGWRLGEDFTSLNSDKVMAPLYGLASTLGGRGRGWTLRTAAGALAYPYFERLLWQRFGDDLRRGRFDLVHQITPLTPTAAPRLPVRCAKIGVPFVWGPLNGGVPWPRAFDAARHREREWLSYVRGAYRLMPGYKASRRHVSAIVAGSRYTFESFPQRYREKTFYLAENAIDPSRFSRQRGRSAVEERAAGRPLKLIFLGRLVPYKGCDMLLAAAEPMLRDGTVTVDVIGDGPEAENLRRTAATLPNVTFVGKIPHEQVEHCLADADALVFPSIREFGGGVCLEAMAVGLPAAVVDYGGPGELVTPDTGWLIPMGNRDEVVAGTRAAVRRMLDDPAGVDARGLAARGRVLAGFTWSEKAAVMLEIYRWVLKQGPRPHLPPPGTSDFTHNGAAAPAVSSL